MRKPCINGRHKVLKGTEGEIQHKRLVVSAQGRRQPEGEPRAKPCFICSNRCNLRKIGREGKGACMSSVLRGVVSH